MFKLNRSIHLALILACLFTLFPPALQPVKSAPTVLPYPIMFATQMPVPADFTTIGSVFGNHMAGLQEVGRGGDLWIRYTNGNLRNLTLAAGYGNSGFQGATSIAVRDPAIYWDGTKAIFSMVVGAPTQQWQVETYYWQLYEITNFAETETPIITPVPNQPTTYNNVQPIYGSDNRIIFVSDRPFNGAAHLYPQRDEYEEAPTPSGLWSLNPTTGNLFLMEHAPSGSFTPILASDGRVIFTRWDHLQRDQQADADEIAGGDYGTFNYTDESATARRLSTRVEVFPEPRAERTDLLTGTNVVGHSFNHFFPWQINEDGTEEETLNHIGRHELHTYFDRSFNDDPNLTEYIFTPGSRFNDNPLFNFLEVDESVTQPGVFIGVDAPEFATHASGQILTISGTRSLNGDQMGVIYLTHRDTASYMADDDPPNPNHSGHYRDPLPLSDGSILVAHTIETRADRNEGTRTNPISRYAFRLKPLTLSGQYYVAGAPLTTGISKTLSFWDPDEMVTYSGNLWELYPVEVRARTRPTLSTPAGLGAPELQMLTQAGVTEPELETYLTQNNLALIVSRNVTTRDEADVQQPFNLHVPGGAQTVGAGGHIYDISYLQLYEARLLRGIGGTTDPRDGRRVLAQAFRDTTAFNPPTLGPDGTVALGLDGSMAAFVPARRALSWQLTDAAGTGVVRERYWLTFQPGEMRVCASCHGLNDLDQAGNTLPTNPPQALYTLLQYWRRGPTTHVYLPTVSGP